MTTYHICDLCGKDIKDRPIFFIQITPESIIRNATDFERILHGFKKEVCEDCAKAWVDNFNKLDKLKDDPDWEAKIYSPKYEGINGDFYYNNNDFYKMEVSKYR